MSSSSSTSPQWKPDVFVSSGEGDVITTFIANLFKRLNQVGINCVEHDHTEGAGQEMAECLKAIPEVRLALVVFSTNYVNSELVEILNCNWDPELVVIPVFYIDGPEVSEFASEALAAAKKILGHYELKAANSDASKLIDKIVERLVKEIYSQYPPKEDFPPKKDFGPFGGKGKKTWECHDVNGIDICYADFIESIAFKVDTNTSSIAFKVDTNTSSNFKVKLEEGEYISSFAGYFNNADNRINSLTFRTNQRIWGPFGREEGEYFSVPSKAGKVIRFFGTSHSEFLESIGGRVELNSKEFYRVQSAGLIGKKMEPKWDDGRTHANVRKIVVELHSKRFIRSIEFTYEEENGRLGEPKRHGSNTGQEVVPYPIELGANEYLTSISGYYTDDGITSLRFRTNKQMSRPIGKEEGTHFSSPATAGKIVGFYGFGDEHLCGIGAHFEPISDLDPVKSIGPFRDGYDRDGRKFDGVREIHPFVNDDTKYIHGIKVVYDNGSVEGNQVTYGNCTKGVFRRNQPVDLDYPREYLTSLSGYTQEDGSISSLTFHSNKQRHGPFGKEEGIYFWYPSTGSRIISFYGRWGETLNSIGVYVEPIPHLYPFKIVTPFEGSGGTPWDDGVHTNVRGFRVTAHGPKESRIIKSITFMYDDNGSLVEGSRHGGGDASSGDWVMLDFPKERLTKIKGWYMREGGPAGQTIIHDLRIVTTKQTPIRYAPREDQSSSKEFAIPEQSKDGRIVGFFGMAGTHLNSIGARLEPYLIVGVLKKKALIHGRRLKKNEDKMLQAFNEEELLKHEGKECQQRSLKSSPRIATLVYCIGFVCVLLLTWWTFLCFLI